MEFFAGVGLIQGDSVGVKSCPMELGLISAVKGIAEQRALQGCHVEADLVGSAGFQVEGEALVGFSGPEGFIEGSGGFAVRKLLPYPGCDRVDQNKKQLDFFVKV